MVKQQGLTIRTVAECLVLMLGMGTQALAVWPPSTAFQEEQSSTLYGLIVVAFMIGIAIGVWSQKNHHHR